MGVLALLERSVAWRLWCGEFDDKDCQPVAACGTGALSLLARGYSLEALEDCFCR